MKQVKYSFGGAIDRFRPFFFAAALCLTTSLGAQSPFPDEGMPETDFRPIFDGRTLDGWTYDPVYWRVEEGCIVGEVTPETLLERNSFIIWRGDAPADFELKMEYRVSAEGNSGINYRSSEVPGVPDALRGYQLDIDGQGEWTGQNYEERGRTFLALRGQVSCVETGKKPYVVGSTCDKAELFSQIDRDGWNECHVIARGHTLIHLINGHVMSVVVDDDPQERTSEGLIGMQVHVGPPMKIEFRNIRLKTDRKEVSGR